jgi:hypothetical protein
MKNKTNILLILISFTFINCNSYKPRIGVSGKIIKGKIIDGETGEILIGQSVNEYDRFTNNTLTDTLGNFELKFLGNNPIIALTGFYEPFYIEMNPNEFNNIVLDSKTIKESKKTFNRISKFRQSENKKYTKTSLIGTWEVVAINKFVNPDWKYLDEIESGLTDKRLGRLFPCELKENSLLKFEADKKLIVNSGKEYRFSKGENYLSIRYSDVVYMYKYEFKNENTLSFRKEISLGESEWVIKRK